MTKKPYTVKQLQHDGTIDGSHWVIIWSGYARSKKQAVRRASKELTIIALEE